MRGPQHHYAWCEEVSSWKDARKGDALETTWSNVKLGCRLGENPQIVLTSTPKANQLTKDLLALDGGAMRVVRGSSYENRANLSEAWWREVVAPLEGTRTGLQEIHAHVLEDVEGALWTRAQLDELRVQGKPAPLDGVTPPFGRVLNSLQGDQRVDATDGTQSGGRRSRQADG